MRVLDLALNAVIILSAMVFSAYIGHYYFDFGLFTALPDSVARVFTSLPAIQYVAVGVAASALIAKIPVGRAIKRQEAVG
jgi:hypothetical protein